MNALSASVKERKQAWYEPVWVQVGLHAAFWAGLTVLPHLLSYDTTTKPTAPPPKPFGYFPTVIEVASLGFTVGIFYLNAFLLTPRLLYTRKYLIFIAAALGLLACKVLIFFPLLHFTGDMEEVHVGLITYAVGNFFVVLFLLALSISYRMIRDKIRADRLTREKQEENLKTELSFLRSQISPHFMFNVLNNIVALVRMKSDKLEPTIFKLSSLMRYMLYQMDDHKIPLMKEVEYLQNYIDLQEMRVGEKLRLHANLKVGDEPFEIEPMLLIPFIENAFKHGTGYISHPQIDIHLSVTDGLLYFTVRNKYNPEHETKDAVSGIGLANVRRRLNLLYGARHDLWVTTRNDWFLVSLQLNLHYVAVHSG